MSDKQIAINKLIQAQAALRDAADALEQAYGKGISDAAELRGAAAVIDGWVIQIHEEVKR